MCKLPESSSRQLEKLVIILLACGLGNATAVRLRLSPSEEGD